MSLHLTEETHRRAHARLAPGAQLALARAAAHAQRLHAEEVAPEHLLSALMDDEDSAAHRAVLHSFVDPPTVSCEALALSPGIVLVASARSLPFSVRGVEALYAARQQAGERVVEPEGLLVAAAARLEPELLSAIAPAEGVLATAVAAVPGADEPEAWSGSVFRTFGEEAKRTLALACRTAARLEREAIAPAHLLLAALERERALEGRFELSLVRVRAAFDGRDADPTRPPDKALPPSEELGAFLDALPASADTLGLLEHFLQHASEELRGVLRRNRVTATLIERARGAFRDPEPPG